MPKISSIDWHVEPIQKRHERKTFSCGKDELDEYLRHYARKNDALGLGRTYVAVQPGQVVVKGYYTIAPGAVAFGDLPGHLASRLPRYPIPVVLLARLAVDESVQGRGLGKLLLLDALNRSLEVARELGVHAVAVDAIDDDARSFYLKYGFESLEDERLHMFLSIKAIGRTFSR